MSFNDNLKVRMPANSHYIFNARGNVEFGIHPAAATSWQTPLLTDRLPVEPAEPTTEDTSWQRQHWWIVRKGNQLSVTTFPPASESNINTKPRVGNEPDSALWQSVRDNAWRIQDALAGSGLNAYVIPESSAWKLDEHRAKDSVKYHIFSVPNYDKAHPSNIKMLGSLVSSVDSALTTTADYHAMSITRNDAKFPNLNDLRTALAQLQQPAELPYLKESDTTYDFRTAELEFRGDAIDKLLRLIRNRDALTREHGKLPMLVTGAHQHRIDGYLQIGVDIVQRPDLEQKIKSKLITSLESMIEMEDWKAVRGYFAERGKTYSRPESQPHYGLGTPLLASFYAEEGGKIQKTRWGTYRVDQLLKGKNQAGLNLRWQDISEGGSSSWYSGQSWAIRAVWPDQQYVLEEFKVTRKQTYTLKRNGEVSTQVGIVKPPEKYELKIRDEAPSTPGKTPQ